MTRTTRKGIRAERFVAFERVVAEYEAPLLRYAARMVNDPDAAQDIVQDVFVRLFRKWKEDLLPSPQLSSWLYRVTHNRAVDYLRKKSRRELLHMHHAKQEPSFAPPDRGHGFRISEAAERAAQGLRSLSHREQQLVILKVYEEKSYREISEITGLTMGNVGYILHHTMKKLAAAMGEPRGGAQNEAVPRQESRRRRS